MLEPERSTECLSSLRCDQLLNGELEDPQATEAHCASCQRCAARLAAHRRERASFLVPLRQPRRHQAWMIWTASAAAVVGLWLVLAPRRPETEDTRSKGKSTIGFYVKHGDAVRRGSAGEVVFPNDALNFTASTDRPCYVAIVSIDRARKVSLYYPDGATAARLQAGQDQVLPLGVVLDDTLGSERIHGVFCDRAVPVEQLEAALVPGAAWPSGCVVDSVTIEKQRAP